MSKMTNKRIAGIGLGVAVAAFVGIAALSGQYVPPTGPLQTIKTLIVSGTATTAALTNSGPLTESGICRVGTVTGALDNWAPTCGAGSTAGTTIATARTIEATLTGNATLSSIAASQAEGRTLRVCSTAASAAFKLTVTHDSTGTAANQIRNPGQVSIVVPSGACLDLRYAAGVSRWIDTPGIGVYSSEVAASTAACSTGERLEWDGSAWQCRVVNDYRGKHLEWNEELMVNTPGNTENFAQVLSGAGTQAVAGSSTRPGVMGYETGTTNTGRAGRRTSDVVVPGDWTTTTVALTGCVPTLSTSSEEYTVELGTHDVDSSAEAVDGCYFFYDRGNVHSGGCNTGNADKWEAVASNNSTRTIVLLDGSSQNGACAAGSITTVSSAIAACTLPDTGFHTYEVIQSAATSCVFKIDGATVATLTTNIPATGRYTRASFRILKSAGITTRLFYVDRWRFAIDLPAARSP